MTTMRRPRPFERHVQTLAKMAKITPIADVRLPSVRERWERWLTKQALAGTTWETIGSNVQEAIKTVGGQYAKQASPATIKLAAQSYLQNVAQYKAANPGLTGDKYKQYVGLVVKAEFQHALADLSKAQASGMVERKTHPSATVTGPCRRCDELEGTHDVDEPDLWYWHPNCACSWTPVESSMDKDIPDAAGFARFARLTPLAMFAAGISFFTDKEGKVHPITDHPSYKGQSHSSVSGLSVGDVLHHEGKSATLDNFGTVIAINSKNDKHLISWDHSGDLNSSGKVLKEMMDYGTYSKSTPDSVTAKSEEPDVSKSIVTGLTTGDTLFHNTAGMQGKLLDIKDNGTHIINWEKPSNVIGGGGAYKDSVALSETVVESLMDHGIITKDAPAPSSAATVKPDFKSKKQKSALTGLSVGDVLDSKNNGKLTLVSISGANLHTFQTEYGDKTKLYPSNVNNMLKKGQLKKLDGTESTPATQTKIIKPDASDYGIGLLKVGEMVQSKQGQKYSVTHFDENNHYYTLSAKGSNFHFDIGPQDLESNLNSGYFAKVDATVPTPPHYDHDEASGLNVGDVLHDDTGLTGLVESVWPNIGIQWTGGYSAVHIHPNTAKLMLDNGNMVKGTQTDEPPPVDKPRVSSKAAKLELGDTVSYSPRKDGIATNVGTVVGLNGIGFSVIKWDKPDEDLETFYGPKTAKKLLGNGTIKKVSSGTVLPEEKKIPTGLKVGDEITFYSVGNLKTRGVVKNISDAGDHLIKWDDHDSPELFYLDEMHAYLGDGQMTVDKPPAPVAPVPNGHPVTGLKVGDSLAYKDEIGMPSYHSVVKAIDPATGIHSFENGVGAKWQSDAGEVKNIVDNPDYVKIPGSAPSATPPAAIPDSEPHPVTGLSVGDSVSMQAYIDVPKAHDTVTNIDSDTGQHSFVDSYGVKSTYSANEMASFLENGQYVKVSGANAKVKAPAVPATETPKPTTVAGLKVGDKVLSGAGKSYTISGITPGGGLIIMNNDVTGLPLPISPENLQYSFDHEGYTKIEGEPKVDPNLDSVADLKVGDKLTSDKNNTYTVTYLEPNTKTHILKNDATGSNQVYSASEMNNAIASGSLQKAIEQPQVDLHTSPNTGLKVGDKLLKSNGYTYTLSALGGGDTHFIDNDKTGSNDVYDSQEMKDALASGKFKKVENKPPQVDFYASPNTGLKVGDKVVSDKGETYTLKILSSTDIHVMTNDGLGPNLVQSGEEVKQALDSGKLKKVARQSLTTPTPTVNAPTSDTKLKVGDKLVTKVGNSFTVQEIASSGTHTLKDDNNGNVFQVESPTLKASLDSGILAVPAKEPEDKPTSTETESNPVDPVTGLKVGDIISSPLNLAYYKKGKTKLIEDFSQVIAISPDGQYTFASLGEDKKQNPDYNLSASTVKHLIDDYNYQKVDPKEIENKPTPTPEVNPLTGLKVGDIVATEADFDAFKHGYGYAKYFYKVTNIDQDGYHTLKSGNSTSTKSPESMKHLLDYNLFIKVNPETLKASEISTLDALMTKAEPSVPATPDDSVKVGDIVVHKNDLDSGNADYFYKVVKINPNGEHELKTLAELSKGLNSDKSDDLPWALSASDMKDLIDPASDAGYVKVSPNELRKLLPHYIDAQDTKSKSATTLKIGDVVASKLDVKDYNSGPYGNKDYFYKLSTIEPDGGYVFKSLGSPENAPDWPISPSDLKDLMDDGSYVKVDPNNLKNIITDSGASEGHPVTGLKVGDKIAYKYGLSDPNLYYVLTDVGTYGKHYFTTVDNPGYTALQIDADVLKQKLDSGTYLKIGADNLPIETTTPTTDDTQEGHPVTGLEVGDTVYAPKVSSTSTLTSIDPKTGDHSFTSKNGKKWVNTADAVKQKMDAGDLTKVDPSQNSWGSTYTSEPEWQDTGKVYDAGDKASIPGTKYFNDYQHNDAVGWADKTFLPTVKTLSQDEINALGQYRNGEYTSVNKALRQKSSKTKQTSAVIHAMDSAINKVTTPENMLVFRGVSSNAFDYQDPKTLIGSKYTDPGYMSCSLIKGKIFPKTYTLVITCPKGTHGMWMQGLDKHQNYKGPAHPEDEWLMARGTTLQIDRVEGSNVYMTANVQKKWPVPKMQPGSVKAPYSFAAYRNGEGNGRQKARRTLWEAARAYYARRHRLAILH